MAKESKRPAKYDLNKADRRRNLLIQIGLTAVVVAFGVALVLYIVTSKVDKPAAGEGKPIRVTSPELITTEGTTEPKAVLALYEDFLCPGCAGFEQRFGPTINQLIDSGAVAADYYMVGILDRPHNQDYSSRAGGAAYCVADESIDAFRRFHSALYAMQPSEAGAVYPSNAQLIEFARQAGAAGSVPECINSERYVEMVKGMAAATDISATPTVRINGEDWDLGDNANTPEALIEKIESIVGEVPDITPPPPPPAPAPTAGPPPAPAPAPTAP